MKSLYDISWQCSEPEYRKDPAFSYSTLAKYERTGFEGIPNLWDKVESSSLTFGSMVDALITGGQEEFNSNFYVADFPQISDTIIKIIKYLFGKFKDDYNELKYITDSDIIDATNIYGYQLNWKPETRAKVIKEKGNEYYRLLYNCGTRTLVDCKTYNEVLLAVKALQESPASSWYFAPNNPFDGIERLYQLKFKATLNGIDYRCMFDLLICDYNNKTIQPVDLKTSHKKEYNFYKSFVEWNYQIQNRLYYRILQNNIFNDEYFKDFKILPYKDIVVCKDSLNPLVWDCPFTFDRGTLTYGKYNQIIFRDPEEIAKELKYYINSQTKVPIGIDGETSNNLEEFLKTM